MQNPYIGHIYRGIGGLQYEVLGHGYDPDSYILLRREDKLGFVAHGAWTVGERIGWTHKTDEQYQDSPHRFTGGRAV